MCHHGIVFKAVDRTGRTVARHRIEDEQLFRPREEMQQLRAERSAVKQADIGRKTIVFLQILYRTHAEPLIPQDDVADAEHRHGRDRNQLVLIHIHRDSSCAAFFAAACARSHAYHAESPSPVRHETGRTAIPGCSALMSAHADAISKFV